MIKLNFPTYLVKIIHKYLDHRTFNEKINSTSSSVRSIAAGTPQGSILSPALYIYTSDFPTTPSVSVCLFADEMPPFSAIALPPTKQFELHKLTSPNLKSG
ncbi:hypothetical protein TNCV_4164731 [Trichonephila clavipes]|nr:hypothetical protein TNCV_4164731 [Trichonephila clavipes]